MHKSFTGKIFMSSILNDFWSFVCYRTPPRSLNSFYENQITQFRLPHSWKDFGLFVIIKSMQIGFMVFLKQVVSLTIFLQSYVWQKFFIVASFGSTLKSPVRIKFSYCSSCESKFLPTQFRWLAIKFFSGL